MSAVQEVPQQITPLVKQTIWEALNNRATVAEEEGASPQERQRRTTL